MLNIVREAMQTFGAVTMLKQHTVKELLVVAKQLNIKGRHDMKKAELITAIVSDREKLSALEKQFAKEAKDIMWGEINIVASAKHVQRKNSYIEAAKIGQLVAFKVSNQKVLSGKIEEIHRAQFVITTKNGIKFTVDKENVIWVKTTDRWPKGVYLALKGESGPDEYKRPSFKSL